MRPYIFSSIHFILVIENCFLRILRFVFIKSGKNLTVQSFFCLINVGLPNLIWSPLCTPKCHIRSTYFVKTSSFTLVTGYSFVWYGFSSVYSSISIGFVFPIPRDSQNRKLYLVSRFCSLHTSFLLIVYCLMQTSMGWFFIAVLQYATCIPCGVHYMFVFP